MSGTPKRSHEEGIHSTALKRPPEESGLLSSPGKLFHQAGSDFRMPSESRQDGPSAKIQRIEPHDVDRRSSSLHRTASSHGNYLDHSVTAENRLESKSSKDSKNIKAETRETIRELYTDTRIDRQVSRVEKDARLDTNGDEKEIKSDKAPHNVFKDDLKFEKDGCVVANSCLSWKEIKEHHREKKYLDPSTNSLDSWRIARHGQTNMNGVSKSLSTTEAKDSLRTHEAVGENRVEMKAEEKHKEKDNKRKDEKHRDFGDMDKDKNDRINNLQVGGATNVRERNVAQKDEEPNDKDKDPNKCESSNANEKEALDGSVALQQQQNKDDSCRVLDRDITDKGRGMDADVEDKHEKLGNCFDMESDDGCADGETKRSGEAFGNGMRRRRRMLRSRGTSPGPNRQPRARDNEGSQGQSVVYKPGVCMQELLKSWREFEASQDIKNDERFINDPTLEIRIPAEYVTATNHQVRGAQLWGTDIYTNDSDLVAVLMHTGYCRPTASPSPAIHELLATVRVLPPQDCYASTLRNNVRSRAWGAGICCSFQVEQCCIVKKGGGMIDLEPHLMDISAVEPTLAPVSVERAMTTRAAASNARQQRFVREVTVQYNLCNEPWLKYSISIVADKGIKKPLHTAARLKKGEVLYVETHHHRYELCFSGEKSVCNGTLSTSAQAQESEQRHHNQSAHIPNGDSIMSNSETATDVFRWSHCKNLLPQEIMCSIGVPLHTKHLEILEENLEWEDVRWSRTGVWVAGKEYVLARVHFLSHT